MNLTSSYHGAPGASCAPAGPVPSMEELLCSFADDLSDDSLAQLGSFTFRHEVVFHQLRKNRPCEGIGFSFIRPFSKP